MIQIYISRRKEREYVVGEVSIRWNFQMAFNILVLFAIPTTNRGPSKSPNDATLLS